MISFIIPAHNARPYIERALRPFIEAKELQNHFEVIVVENGSTDETLSFLNEIAGQWDFVRVHQSDKGVSKARNKGVEMASGDWIAFVDADDYLLTEGLGEMVAIATNSKEDFWLFGHEAGTEKRALSMAAFGPKEVETARVEMLKNPTKYMQVWAKLFRAEIIKSHGITFNEEMRFSEDSDFTLRYSKCCKSIMFSESIVYHYSVDNASSVMRAKTGDKAKEYALAMQKSALHMEEETASIKDAFEKYVLMHLNIALVREVFCVQNEKNFWDKVKQMKGISKEPVFENAIERTRSTECGSARMLPIWCLKHGLYLVAGMIYWVRAKSNARRENS